MSRLISRLKTKEIQPDISPDTEKEEKSKPEPKKEIQRRGLFYPRPSSQYGFEGRVPYQRRQSRYRSQDPPLKANSDGK